MKRLLLALLAGLFVVGCVEGPAGPAGPQGPQGEQGPQGPDAENAIVTYTGVVIPAMTWGNYGFKYAMPNYRNTSRVLSCSMYYIYDITDSNNLGIVEFLPSVHVINGTIFARIDDALDIEMIDLIPTLGRGIVSIMYNITTMH